MREIKFRCWSDECKMEYSGFSIRADGDLVRNYFFSPKDIMQFTGLLDKNGKEIYEGDIVQCYDGIGSVVWGGGKAGFIFSGGHHTMRMLDEIFELVVNKGEIVGNIYENPELIQ